MSSGPSEVEILSAESIALYTPTTSTYLRRSAESNIKGLETGFEGKADGFDKSSVRYGQRQEHQVERDGQIQQMKNTSLSAASEANHQPVGMRNGTKNGIIIPSDDQQPPNTMAFAHYERELPSSGPSTDVSFQLRSRRLSHAAKDGSRTPPRPIFPPREWFAVNRLNIRTKHRPTSQQLTLCHLHPQYLHNPTTNPPRNPTRLLHRYPVSAWPQHHTILSVPPNRIPPSTVRFHHKPSLHAHPLYWTR